MRFFKCLLFISGKTTVFDWRILYALRVLRDHGLPVSSSLRATILAKIRYCAPAWSGLCSASDRARLAAFLRRSKKCDYCADDVPTMVTDHFAAADKSLFKRVLNNELHVLQPLLSDKTINCVINYTSAQTRQTIINT